MQFTLAAFELPIPLRLQKGMTCTIEMQDRLGKTGFAYLIEKELNLLIGQIDAQLFETVQFEMFKT
jgi:hypothetical protein